MLKSRYSKTTTAFLPPNKERFWISENYDLVREAITTEYDSKFDFPVNNENIQITNIDSNEFHLDRKHTLESGFRFVIGTQAFYVIDLFYGPF